MSHLLTKRHMGFWPPEVIQSVVCCDQYWDAARLCLTKLQINMDHSQQLIPDEEIQTNSMCHCHAIKATVVAQVTQ